MFKFKKESEYDNIEYKEHILNLDKDKLEHHITQMNNRLYLGQGVCQYIIGISDNGDIIGLQYKQILISLNNLLLISSELKINCENIHIIYFKPFNNYIIIIKFKSENNKYIYPEFIIQDENDY